MADTVVQKLDLDISDFGSKIGQTIAGWDSLDERAKKTASQNPFKAQADEVTKLNTKLRDGAKAFGDFAKSPQAAKIAVSQLAGEVNRYGTTQSKATSSGSWKTIQSAIAAVKARLADTNAELEKTPEHTKEAESGFGRLGERIKTALEVTGVLFLIDKLVELGGEIINVTGESEKYKNQFTRIFEGNGQAAAGYLATLQKTADTTNFTFQELADNSSKLASRGIIPSEKELLKLGDTANFINKPFEQLNEAILDANNPERWKELGFVVTTTGNKMTLSYGDFSKTVDKSVKGAYDAIQAFSSQGKVLGSTAEAGKTLSGRISTLEDSFAGLLRTIGQSSKGALNGAIDLITELIQNGIALYKTLSPALDGIGNAFLAIGKAIGPAIHALIGFDDQSHTTATGTQRFGYYLTKYVINPLTGISLVVAGAIEGFAQIFLYLEYASAKVRGDKSLAAALDQQLEESKKRIAAIQKQLADGDKPITLQEYVNQDNQRTRREARRQRLNEEAYENFKPTATKPPKPPVDPKDAKEAESRRVQLLKEQEKLNEDLKKLNDDLDKLSLDEQKKRLETLDKGSAEYLEAQKKIQLKEISLERDHLIEMGQLASGTPYYNTKTKQVEVQKNTNYQLPKKQEDIFTARRNQVETDAGTTFYNKEEADALVRDEQTEKEKRTDLEKKFNSLQLEEQKKQNDYLEKLQRQAGQSETDYEKEKQEALLKIKLDYAKKQLDLIKNDPTKKAEVESLRATITEAQNTLNASKAKGSEGPQDLFDLLGITFSKDPAQNDKMKQAATELAGTVITEGQNILTAQIAASQQQVANYDQQLQAKRSEIDAEIALSKQGLASNVQAKQQEYNQIAEARKKALRQQTTDQGIQIAINTALKESELTLALAKIISNSADFGPLFPFIVGAEIATMFAVLASGAAQINALPKYHTGDEITPETARKRLLAGDKKPNEVDIRAEIGEGVIRKESYQANKGVLTKLNALGRKLQTADLADLLAGTGVELPESTRLADIKLINEANNNRAIAPDYELHRMIGDLSGHVQNQTAEMKRLAQKSITQLPDGRIRVVDERGNVSIYRQT